MGNAMPKVSADRVPVTRWCFTLNNPTQDELDHLQHAFTHENCYFAVLGRETRQSGTQHIQGFIHLNNCQRITGAKRLIGMRAHLEWARGTDAENNAYCSKDGDIWLHIGHPAGGTGGRGGNHMYDTACEIATMLTMTMLTNKESILDILAKGDTYVSSYFRHARVIQELAEAESRDQGLAVASDLLGDPVLKKWQRDLLLQLEGES